MRGAARHICEAVTGGVRGQMVLGACACAAASAALFAFDPARHGFYPSCLFHRATGLYCPGCGATRAAYALLHGRVLEAAQDNLMLLAALPLVSYLAGRWLAQAWRRQAWPEVAIEPMRWSVWSAGFVALMLAFMVVRNLPGAEWLRPSP
jgi:hypothetical protein